MIRACCSGAAAIAVGVLLAWGLGPERVDVPWLFLMKANTAASVALLAWSLLLSCEGTSARSAVGSAAASLVVVAMALATLCAYVAGVNLGLDQLLLPDPQQHVLPGRMAPGTAAALAFLGLGIAVRHVPGRAAAVTADVAWVASGLVMEVVVSGYAYQLVELLGPSIQTRTSPHTVVALSLLWVAFVASRYGTGLLRTLATPGAGSLLARWLLPAALVLPTALGLLRLVGESAGLYAPREGMALFGVAETVLTIALILLLAARLNREEARREEERRHREELERYLTICAWTQRVRWHGEWVPVERYLSERFGIQVSHGMSEEALEQLMADVEGPTEGPTLG